MTQSTAHPGEEWGWKRALEQAGLHLPSEELTILEPGVDILFGELKTLHALDLDDEDPAYAFNPGLLFL